MGQGPQTRKENALFHSFWHAAGARSEKVAPKAIFSMEIVFRKKRQHILSCKKTLSNVSVFIALHNSNLSQAPCFHFSRTEFESEFKFMFDLPFVVFCELVSFWDS